MAPPVKYYELSMRMETRKQTDCEGTARPAIKGMIEGGLILCVGVRVWGGTEEHMHMQALWAGRAQGQRSWQLSKTL